MVLLQLVDVLFRPLNSFTNITFNFRYMQHPFQAFKMKCVISDIFHAAKRFSKKNTIEKWKIFLQTYLRLILNIRYFSTKIKHFKFSNFMNFFSCWKIQARKVKKYWEDKFYFVFVDKYLTWRRSLITNLKENKVVTEYTIQKIAFKFLLGLKKSRILFKFFIN